MEAAVATGSGALASVGTEPTAMPPPLIEPAEPLAVEALRLEQRAEVELPLEVRVGLESDLAEVRLVAPPGGLRASGEGGSLAIPPGAELRARAIVSGSSAGSQRVQVAALRDSRQASGLAERLLALTGWPADAAFDAATGLYRVRVGRFRTRGEADVARRRLAELGAPDAWIASEAGAILDPRIRLETGGSAVELSGREVRLDPTAEGVDRMQWLGARYRGHFLLFVNDRGTLSVINEVALESYLRGVVAREMGPGVYPWIEALEAQAIAARTYSLRHLGEFAHEGYDICATPRCQVYRGLDDEHPLADQAVKATANRVLLDGVEPADTLYSASCGGHTENVRAVFPTLEAGYLRGVPCIEGGSHEIGAGGVRDPLARVAAALAPTGGSGVGSRLARLAERRGLPRSVAGEPNLASPRPESVRRWLQRRFDLLLDARLLGEASALGELAAAPPAEWTLAEQDLARVLAELPDPVEGRAADRLIVALGAVLDLAAPSEGGFLEIRDGRLLLGRAGQRLGAPLARELALGRGTELATATAASSLEVAPGDPLTAWRVAGEVVAVIGLQPTVLGGRSVPQHRAWTRSRSRTELARRVALEYPGFRLGGLEVLERGVSRRVARLRLEDQDGGRALVEGLAIRWLLDLPDTRFEAVANGSGTDVGWTFRGRGWGHGVGMCQTGAAMMARSGRTAQEILDHYYSGLELGTVRRVERVTRWAGQSGPGERQASASRLAPGEGR